MYFQTCRAEKSADSNDLFSNIQKAIDESDMKGLNLSQVMDSWVNKKGYPVVTVTNDNGNITIQQERFITYKNASSNDTNYFWHIPINWYQSDSVSTINNTKAALWLSEKSKDISSEKINPSNWMIFNKQQTGL